MNLGQLLTRRRRLIMIKSRLKTDLLKVESQINFIDDTIKAQEVKNEKTKM